MYRPRRPVETDIKTGRIQEAMARYCLGREKLKAVAREAGAVVKLGKVVLYDFEVLDRYLDEHRAKA